MRGVIRYLYNLECLKMKTPTVLQKKSNRFRCKTIKKAHPKNVNEALCSNHRHQSIA